MADAAARADEAQQDRDDLRRAVRDLCERHVPEEAVRRVMTTEQGHDPAFWQRLAGLDLLGLAVPVEAGGSGAGLGMLCVVAEELGRALVPAPLLGTVALAGTALALVGDEQHLPRLVTGELLATVVAQDALGAWSPSAPTTEATETADGWRLSGTGTHVVDGAAAGLLLVAARAGAEVGLFAVDPAAGGCTVTPMSTLDLTRRRAQVVLDGAPATVLAPPGRGLPVLDRTGDVAAVVLGASQVAVAQRLLDLSVEHARTRYQFGQPIGGFQGVKHRCADMYVAVELARSTVAAAATVADEDPAALPLAAALASATASDAAVQVGGDAIQVHGGIGFTWDSPVHLYYKRAVGDAALLGTVAASRERLAQQVLDDPPDSGATPAVPVRGAVPA